MNRFIAVLVLALAFVSACKKEEQQPILKEVAREETPAVQARFAKESLEVHAKQVVSAKLQTEFKTLLADDSAASAPRSFGYAEPTACDHYGRAAAWERFQQHYKNAEVAIEGVGTDIVTTHFTDAVRATAKTILSIQGKFSNTYSDSLSNPYVYSTCGDGELLEQISSVIDWVRMTNIDPNSVGLISSAVRAKFAEILSAEIKRDQKYSGGGRWLDCMCETSIPYFYNQFRFTREELKLTAEEWGRFTKGPKKGSKQT
ncbi:MAG: hypothetical protein JWN89_617 [Parcubacteria group bacterium]|nr:hypothetical protein [Parcubacteria group bacterium]